MDLENPKSTTRDVLSQNTHPVSIEIHTTKPSAQGGQTSKESPILCTICYVDYSQNEMKSLECKHSFCISCLNEYLKNKIDSMKVLNIPCPSANCGKVIKDYFIKSIIGDEKFKRYQELALNKFSHRNAQERFCPKPGCSKPFYPTPNKEYTVCKCHTQICNICSNFWHPNKSCLEAIDPDFEDYIKKNEIKFCIMCKTAIKRVEGCTHMTCSICDYEWCWTCGREYTRKPRHRCPGRWSPLPPSRVRENRFNIEGLSKIWKYVFLEIEFKSKIIKFLVYPWIFLFFLIVWPFFIFFKHNMDIAELKERSKVKVFISIVLGIILLPIVILMFIFFLIGKILKCICCSKNRSSNRKRWIAQNSQKFTYTGTAKPSVADAPIAPIAPPPRNNLPVTNNNTVQPAQIIAQPIQNPPPQVKIPLPKATTQKIKKQINPRVRTKNNEFKIKHGAKHIDIGSIKAKVQNSKLESIKFELVEKINSPSRIKMKLKNHIEEAKRIGEKQEEMPALKPLFEIEDAEDDNVVINIEQIWPESDVENLEWNVDE